MIMAHKYIFIVLFLSASLSQAAEPATTAEESGRITVCFDIADVVYRRTYPGVRDIYSIGLLYGRWSWKNSEYLPTQAAATRFRQTFHTYLRERRTQSNKPQEVNQILTDEIPLLLPEDLCDWVKGKTSIKQILDDVKAQPTTLEQEIACAILEQTLLPEKQAGMLTMQAGIRELVQSCKDIGCHIVLTGNMDKETLAVLQARDRALFDLFDKHIISGEHQVAKPEPEFFNLLPQGDNVILVEHAQQVTTVQPHAHTRNIKHIVHYYDYRRTRSPLLQVIQKLKGPSR